MSSSITSTQNDADLLSDYQLVKKYNTDFVRNNPCEFQKLLVNLYSEKHKYTLFNIILSLPEDVLHDIIFTDNDITELVLICLSQHWDYSYKSIKYLCVRVRDKIRTSIIKKYNIVHSEYPVIESLINCNIDFLKFILQTVNTEEIYAILKNYYNCSLVFGWMTIYSNDIRKRTVTREQEMKMMYEIIFILYPQYKHKFLKFFLSNGLDPNFFNDKLDEYIDLPSDQHILEILTEYGNNLQIKAVTKYKYNITLLSKHKIAKQRGKPNLLYKIDEYKKKVKDTIEAIQLSTNFDEKNLSLLISSYIFY